MLRYNKISKEVGKIDNFRALARKIIISPNRVRYFLYMTTQRNLFIFQRLICSGVLFLTPTNMNLT